MSDNLRCFPSDAKPAEGGPGPGRTYADPVPIAWDHFKAEILELYRPPMRAKTTCQEVTYILDVVAALGVTSTAELTPSLVARFITSRPAETSPNTTASRLSALRTICNYAAGQGYCRRSPFDGRRSWIRRVEPMAKKHHSREEVARVLSLMASDIGRKASPWSQWRARRLYALASTVAYTGLRKSEALFLRVEDVQLADRMLLIRPRVGNRLKTERSAQPVPIADALAPILAEWLTHLELPEGSAKDATGPTPEWNPEGIPDPGWCFPNSYRTGPWVGGSTGHRPLDRMKKLGQRAGVQGFTFLSLRHSWATHAEFWGLSDAMIQRVLRHTNTQTQWHYRHADAANLRSKVGGVSFGHELAGAELAAAGSAPGDDRPTSEAAPAIPAPAPSRAPHVRKLDQADAAEMRRLRAGGWSYASLVKRYGVSKSTVHYTLYRVIHADAPDWS